MCLSPWPALPSLTNPSSHFVTVVYFYKSIISLCASAQEVEHCLVRQEHIWSDCLLEQVPLTDGLCAKGRLEQELSLKNGTVPGGTQTHE